MLQYSQIFEEWLRYGVIIMRVYCSLSVCLSVTFVCCVKTNIDLDIFEFFSPPGSQVKRGADIPTGPSYNGGMKK